MPVGAGAPPKRRGARQDRLRPDAPAGLQSRPRGSPDGDRIGSAVRQEPPPREKASRPTSRAPPPPSPLRRFYRLHWTANDGRIARRDSADPIYLMAK